VYTAAGPRTPPSSVNENVTSDRSRHGSKSDTQSYLAPSLCKTVKASLCSGLKRNSWRYLVGRKRPVFTLDGRYVVVCREVRPLCGSCRFVCVPCMYCLLCFIALVECLFLLQRGERPPARAGEAGPGPDVFASGRTRNFSFWSTRQGEPVLYGPRHAADPEQARRLPETKAVPGSQGPDRRRWRPA
jgi:hypothetical protein